MMMLGVEFLFSNVRLIAQSEFYARKPSLATGLYEITSDFQLEYKQCFLNTYWRREWKRSLGLVFQGY